YGLTKGQFSATADVGATRKTGAANALPPIDLCALAIQLGASYVGRSFSGDKKQLSAMLKAATVHRGTAVLDVISPCVTFNDHEGSTKSYSYMKDHDEPVHELSFVPSYEEIGVDYDPGTTVEVRMHDGSRLQLRKVEEGYDPRDKLGAVTRIMTSHAQHEVLTGVLYVNTELPNFYDLLNVSDVPLATLPQEMTRPPRKVLDEVMDSLA
ncbi:MAG: thiamine pyrophosphate-dependent enzyme, partial [Myxococcaceae bacterium]